MSAPAFAVIVLVTLAPIVLATVMSFAHVSVGAGSLTFNWIGVANYDTVATSSSMQHALLFTTAFTIVSVAVGLFFGTAVALVLDEMSYGRALVLAFLLLPYSMITVIVAELWDYILNGVYGIANYFLLSLHITNQPITFLGTTNSAFISIVIADTWKTMPFVTLIVLAGLQMIDRELYAAARIDGASWLVRVAKITLPLVKSAMLTAAIFRILQAFGVFDLIFILTGGGPGSSTVPVAMLVYNALFEDFDIGTAATISTIATLIVLIAALASLRVFRLQASEGDK